MRASIGCVRRCAQYCAALHAVRAPLESDAAACELPCGARRRMPRAPITPHRQRRSLSVRALVKQTAAPGFVLADVPVPTIRDDEVLIRVRRAGVCGTDVHI